MECSVDLVEMLGKNLDILVSKTKGVGRTGTSCRYLPEQFCYKIIEDVSPSVLPRRPLPNKMITNVTSRNYSTKSPFFHKFRHLILAITCLCLTSISSNMITFNFTIICMSPENGLQIDAPTYNYTQHEKSMLNWAVGAGAIIGTFPLQWFYTNFGARVVFLIAGVTSTVSTVFVPWLAELDFWYFTAARFFQGIAYAANFACIGVVCVIWAPLKETATFIAFMSSFTPFSSLITNPVAGILCETLGWPSVYYTHAIFGAFVFLLWILFYTDKPRKHSFVSIKELDIIHKDKSEAHREMDSFVPYWEICKDPAVLTIWFNALADIGTSIFIIMYAPTYFKSVLKFGIAQTGVLGMMPVLLNALAKISSGYASDMVRCVSEKIKLLTFNTLALVPPAILLFVLGFIPEEQKWIAFWITVAIQCFLGANCGGFYKAAPLVARQYSHFVIANIQFIKCLALFLAPGLVAIFVSDDASHEQWKHVFIVLGVILIAANIMFCLIVRDQPREFTRITKMSKMNLSSSRNKIIPM